MLELKSINCPICDSSQKKTVGDPKIIDKIFSQLTNPDISEVKVVACENCSLIFLDPFPFFTPQLLSKMYSNENEYFPDLNPEFAEIIHKKNPQRRFKKAQKRAKRKIKNYLEIGCGEGHALKMAQDLGWNVQGQDISSDFASKVKDKTGVDIKVGQITEHSFLPESFDLIYIDSVLEHLPNPLEYMTNLKSFLAPGGVIYLTLPNENSLPNTLIDLIQKLRGKKFTSRIMPFAEPYHILGFSKKSIQKLAKQLDLQIADLICKHNYYHIPRQIQSLSLKKQILQKLFSIFHSLSDTTNQGMNMEVVLVK